MSQQQKPRPQSSDRDDPIKYGDVFNVQGGLADQPVAPEDAKAMQSAENQVLGENPRGGPAAVMQSAANVNVRAGLLHPNDASAAFSDQGVTVSETTAGGDRIIYERVAGQVVGQYVRPAVPVTTPRGTYDPDAITIGEALEASAMGTAGDRPVDKSDAAAIQAAEMRATGKSEIVPGGIGAQAQSAADLNPRAICDEQKTTLSDVIGDATLKLGADRAVTREDAEGVIEAEVRNKPDMRTTPGGVAAAMAAAVRLNQSK